MMVSFYEWQMTCRRTSSISPKLAPAWNLARTAVPLPLGPWWPSLVVPSLSARLLSTSLGVDVLSPANVELWSGVCRHLPCAIHRHLTEDAFLPCTRCPGSVGLPTVPPSRAMVTLLWPIVRGEQRSLDMPPPPFLRSLCLARLCVPPWASCWAVACRPCACNAFLCTKPPFERRLLCSIAVCAVAARDLCTAPFVHGAAF